MVNPVILAITVVMHLYSLEKGIMGAPCPVGRALANT